MTAIHPLAAGFLQNAPQLDVSRQQILELQLQEPQIGFPLTQASTLSAYRVGPNVVYRWDDFAGQVIQYHTQVVSQADKLALIAMSSEVNSIYNNVGLEVIENEGDVKAMIDREPMRFHQMLTSTGDGQPLPSDRHSEVKRFAYGMRLAGWSDYFFRSVDMTRPTVLMHGKCPWEVTPESIEQVLNGTAAAQGYHAGRLAVEQMFGYMYNNNVELGIISTVYGWVFLRRQDQGQLYMTPMFACRNHLGQGYTVPQGFTIIQALYYFSRLGEDCPPLEETTGAQPGFIHVDRASTTYPIAAPHIEIREEREFMFYDPANPAQWYEEAPQPQYVLERGKQAYELIFESWNHDKQLGEKTWLCKLIFPRSEDIIIKIWDSYKCDSSARDREVAAYMKLQSLWGKVIPSLIAAAPISIFHGLIIEYIEGSKLSAENWTVSIEQKLRDALAAIHDLGMIHGDVRLEDILIGKDETVWFLDFETAFLADSIALAEARKAMFQEDESRLNGCFNSVRPQKS